QRRQHVAPHGDGMPAPLQNRAARAAENPKRAAPHFPKKGRSLHSSTTQTRRRKLAKDDADKAGSTAAVEKGLGALERAWDAHWALRLICLVLFLDMAMMLRAGR